MATPLLNSELSRMSGSEQVGPGATPGLAKALAVGGEVTAGMEGAAFAENGPHGVGGMSGSAHHIAVPSIEEAHRLIDEVRMLIGEVVLLVRIGG